MVSHWQSNFAQVIGVHMLVGAIKVGWKEVISLQMMGTRPTRNIIKKRAPFLSPRDAWLEANSVSSPQAF